MKIIALLIIFFLRVCMSFVNAPLGIGFLGISGAFAYKAFTTATNPNWKKENTQRFPSLPFIGIISDEASRLIQQTSKVALWTLGSLLSAYIAYSITKEPIGSTIPQPQSSFLPTEPPIDRQELRGDSECYNTGNLYEATPLTREELPSSFSNSTHFSSESDEKVSSDSIKLNFTLRQSLSEQGSFSSEAVFNSSIERALGIQSDELCPKSPIPMENNKSKLNTTPAPILKLHTCPIESFNNSNVSFAEKVVNRQSFFDTSINENPSSFSNLLPSALDLISEQVLSFFSSVWGQARTYPKTSAAVASAVVWGPWTVKIYRLYKGNSATRSQSPQHSSSAGPGGGGGAPGGGASGVQVGGAVFVARAFQSPTIDSGKSGSAMARRGSEVVQNVPNFLAAGGQVDVQNFLKALRINPQTGIAHLQWENHALVVAPDGQFQWVQVAGEGFAELAAIEDVNLQDMQNLRDLQARAWEVLRELIGEEGEPHTIEELLDLLAIYNGRMLIDNSRSPFANNPLLYIENGAVSDQSSQEPDGVADPQHSESLPPVTPENNAQPIVTLLPDAEVPQLLLDAIRAWEEGNLRKAQVLNQLIKNLALNQDDQIILWINRDANEGVLLKEILKKVSTKNKKGFYRIIIQRMVQAKIDNIQTRIQSEEESSKALLEAFEQELAASRPGSVFEEQFEKLLDQLDPTQVTPLKGGRSRSSSDDSDSSLSFSFFSDSSRTGSWSAGGRGHTEGQSALLRAGSCPIAPAGGSGSLDERRARRLFEMDDSAKGGASADEGSSGFQEGAADIFDDSFDEAVNAGAQGGSPKQNNLGDQFLGMAGGGVLNFDSSDDSSGGGGGDLSGLDSFGQELSFD